MQMRIGKLLQLGIAAYFCIAVSGCASPLKKATDQFRGGAYSEALATLEDKSDEISNRDLLLLQLNKGLVLHQLGRFEESNRALLAATDTMEKLSRVSVSEQISTLAVNDWLAAYRGEYSEQLWVHSYLMMNFLLLDKPESAAVEARRALQVFATQPESLKAASFTRALVATSFENAGLINDAYIEYKLLAENNLDTSNIADKLYNQALQLGFADDAEKFRPHLLNTTDTPVADSIPQGELIVFLSRGDLPYKISGNVFFPPDIRLSWPEYGPSYQHLGVIDVFDNDSLLPYKSVESDFASLARTSLYSRGKSIAIKQALRVGAKHSIVNEVADENALAGGLLQIALFVLEEADTRGWDSLPSSMSMLRIPLNAGVHSITLGANGHELTVFPGVNIDAGRTTFRHFRIESYSGEPSPVRTPHHRPVTVEYQIEKTL